MAYLVMLEHKPFCYKDFLYFVVGGKEYRMSHGTFRNKISKFRKIEKVELAYYSNCAYYTLVGQKFGKSMTQDHTRVHNNPIFKMLQQLPFDRQCIHDIRLKLKIPGISKILSVNPNFRKIKRSNDILVPSWVKENAIIKITIHQTDTVSVIIGCTLRPIPLDFGGIIRFFIILVWVQAKLQSILDTNDFSNIASNNMDLIPNYKKWIITMWHFGRDAKTEYDGEKFNITIEEAEHILRVYVKEIDGGKKIRIESQEYPKVTVVEAINERLNAYR